MLLHVIFIIIKCFLCIFQQYLSFKEELRVHVDIYERFKSKAESQTFLVLSEDKWTYLQHRWSYVTSQVHVWQWKLDSNLPGRLGQIGDWLYRAEELLNFEAKPSDHHEESADQIRAKINEHKVSIKLFRTKNCNVRLT